MTFDEILAHNRNLKRRRVRHRTTKEPPLSHTEEIRKLIGTQMEALEHYISKNEISQVGSTGEIFWHKNKIQCTDIEYESNKNVQGISHNMRKHESIRLASNSSSKSQYYRESSKRQSHERKYSPNRNKMKKRSRSR